MTFLNNSFMKVNYYNLSILDFFKIFSKISRGKSLMRINHEMFLKKITLKEFYKGKSKKQIICLS